MVPVAVLMVIVVLVLAAVGMSVYNILTLTQLRKEVANSVQQASDTSAVALAVAGNAKRHLLNLQEFDNLDPEIKGLYQTVYVRKVMPAAIKVVNSAWKAVPADTKKKLKAELVRAGDQAVKELEKMAAQAPAMVAQMGSSGAGNAILPGVVRQTMKPIAKASRR